MLRPAVDCFAITQPEVDAEIDTETDKQDGKGHRYQVERSDSRQGEGGGPRQSHEERRDGSPGEARGAEADHQQDGNQDQRERGGQPHPLANAGQFLLGQGGRAGQANADAVFGVESQFAGNFSQHLHGPLGRRE